MNIENYGYKIKNGVITAPIGAFSLIGINGAWVVEKSNIPLKFQGFVLIIMGGVLLASSASWLSAGIALFFVLLGLLFLTQQETHVIVQTSSGAVTAAKVTVYPIFFWSKMEDLPEAILDAILKETGLSMADSGKAQPSNSHPKLSSVPEPGLSNLESSSVPSRATDVRNHYDNLKVSRNAPDEVIAAAYRSLAKKYHPDQNNSDPEATRILQIINRAYEVLSDPVRRAEHDRWIDENENPHRHQRKRPRA